MERINPEKVIEILKAYNVQISLEQAKLILDFMFKFVRITLNQNEGI